MLDISEIEVFYVFVVVLVVLDVIILVEVGNVMFVVVFFEEVDELFEDIWMF